MFVVGTIEMSVVGAASLGVMQPYFFQDTVNKSMPSIFTQKVIVSGVLDIPPRTGLQTICPFVGVQVTLAVFRASNASPQTNDFRNIEVSMGFVEPANHFGQYVNPGPITLDAIGASMSFV